MIAKTLIAPAAALWSMSAAAQDAAPANNAPVAGKPTGAGDGPSGQGSASNRPKLWSQIEVSPEIVSDTPFSSEHTDSTDVKWSFGLNYNLPSGLDLGLSLGPSVTVDSDRDTGEGSKFNVVASLTTHEPVLLGLTPTLKYQFAQRYQRFFGDRDGTEHTVDATLGFQHKFTLGKLGVNFGVRRFDSTRANSDYWSFRLLPKLTFPIFNNSVDLTFAFNVERRTYDDLTPAIGRQRSDWRTDAVTGLNFARAINNYLDLRDRGRTEARDLFQDFLIGVHWIRIRSNVDGQDSSSFKFTPSVSIRLTF